MYCIWEIQQAMHDIIKSHIFLASAITEYDIVLTLFSVGKKKAVSVLEDGKERWGILDVFRRVQVSHDAIIHVEMFMLRLEVVHPHFH